MARSAEEILASAGLNLDGSKRDKNDKVENGAAEILRRAGLGKSGTGYGSTEDNAYMRTLQETLNARSKPKNSGGTTAADAAATGAAETEAGTTAPAVKPANEWREGLPGPQWDEIEDEEKPKTQSIGQYGRGNIDLYNRPQLQNEDGSISTVRSASFNIDGKEVLLPTIARDKDGNAVQLTDEQAVSRYRETGEYLGKFDTVEEADKYAQQLHDEQAAYYAKDPGQLSLPSVDKGKKSNWFTRIGQKDAPQQSHGVLDAKEERIQGLTEDTSWIDEKLAARTDENGRSIEDIDKAIGELDEQIAALNAQAVAAQNNDDMAGYLAIRPKLQVLRDERDALQKQKDEYLPEMRLTEDEREAVGRLAQNAVDNINTSYEQLATALGCSQETLAAAMNDESGDQMSRLMSRATEGQRAQARTIMRGISDEYKAIGTYNTVLGGDSDTWAEGLMHSLEGAASNVAGQFQGTASWLAEAAGRFSDWSGGEYGDFWMEKSENMYQKSLGNIERGSDLRQQATANAGTGKKLAMDLVGTTAEMVPDYVVSGIAMGSGIPVIMKAAQALALGTMFLRVFGGKNTELHDGAKIYDNEGNLVATKEIGFGKRTFAAAVSAGIEVLTELMFNGYGAFRGSSIFGKLTGRQVAGAASGEIFDVFRDNMVSQISKVGSRPIYAAVLSLALAGVEEGAEEIAAWLTEPWQNRITMNDEEWCNYYGIDQNSWVPHIMQAWANTTEEGAYSFIIGALMGMTGGVTNVGGTYHAQQHNEIMRGVVKERANAFFNGEARLSEVITDNGRALFESAGITEDAEIDKIGAECVTELWSAAERMGIDVSDVDPQGRAEAEQTAQEAEQEPVQAQQEEAQTEQAQQAAQEAEPVQTQQAAQTQQQTERAVSQQEQQTREIANRESRPETYQDIIDQKIVEGEHIPVSLDFHRQLWEQTSEVLYYVADGRLTAKNITAEQARAELDRRLQFAQAEWDKAHRSGTTTAQDTSNYATEQVVLDADSRIDLRGRSYDDILEAVQDNLGPNGGLIGKYQVAFEKAGKSNNYKPAIAITDTETGEMWIEQARKGQLSETIARAIYNNERSLENYEQTGPYQNKAGTDDVGSDRAGQEVHQRGAAEGEQSGAGARSGRADTENSEKVRGRYTGQVKCSQFDSAFSSEHEVRVLDRSEYTEEMRQQTQRCMDEFGFEPYFIEGALQFAVKEGETEEAAGRAYGLNDDDLIVARADSTGVTESQTFWHEFFHALVRKQGIEFLEKTSEELQRLLGPKKWQRMVKAYANHYKEAAESAGVDPDVYCVEEILCDAYGRYLDRTAYHLTEEECASFSEFADELKKEQQAQGVQEDTGPPAQTEIAAEDESQLPSVEEEDVSQADETFVRFSIDNKKPSENVESINKVLGGTAFSGGGTVDYAVSAIIDSQFGVEYNDKIRPTWQANNPNVNAEDFGKLVQEFDATKWRNSLGWFHASPVCCTFSKMITKAAKANRVQTNLDVITAKHTARILRETMPRVFTLENVKGYKGTEGYNIIAETLDELYNWDVGVYNSADFGSATSRERLFIRAVLKGNELPALPEKQEHISWGDKAKDMLDTLPIAKTVNPRMIEHLRDISNIDVSKIDKPLFVFGESYKNGEYGHAYIDQTIPTLWTNTGASRIFMPDGMILEATPQFLARISGLGEDFVLPSSKDLARTIIGNGVPVELTQAVVGTLIKSQYKEQVGGVKLGSRFSLEKKPGDTTEDGRAVDIDGKPGAHRYSLASLAEGTGLKYQTNDEGSFEYFADEKGNKIKTVTPAMIKNSPLGEMITASQRNGFIKAEEAKAQYQMFADLMTMINENKDPFMVWDMVGTQFFSAMKNNSDTQYGKTIDFSTVCKKTQPIVDAMSEAMLRKGEGLTRAEVEEVYLATHEEGETVPCPVCYVFSRWMGIGGVLNNIKKYQDAYGNMSERELNQFVKKIQTEVEQYWKAQGTKKGVNQYNKYVGKNGFMIGKALGEMKGKLNTAEANEMNKIAASTNAQLEIAKLEKLIAEGGLSKTAIAGKRRSIASLRKKVLDEQGIAEVEKKSREFGAKVEELEAYQFIMAAVLKSNDDPEAAAESSYKKRSDFAPVPDEILFDLNRGADFLQVSPATWKYRTTRGAALGKAILPYSDARVGESVQGVHYANVSDIKIGKELNPFLNGKKQVADYMLQSAIKKMRRQNLIGGMRYQSTSDFRYEYGSDYLMTFLEMQAMGANVQLYTKVIEAVDFLASMGADCNLSVMPLSDGFVELEDGTRKLIYSDVTGINYEAALKKTQEYDNVQLILVGISDEHIRLAIEGNEVTFVIPWHGSGNTVHQINVLMQMVGETLGDEVAEKNKCDYSAVQSDHIRSNRNAAQEALWDLRMDIIMGKLAKITTDKKTGEQTVERVMLSPQQQMMLRANPMMQNLYDMFYLTDAEYKAAHGMERPQDAYLNFLQKAQAEHIFPYEYWDTTLRIEQADENGRRFIEYCKAMGVIPRFSGRDSKGKITRNAAGEEFGDFTKDKGYWKLLIDRRMYNLDGTYHQQQKINVGKFNVGMLDAEQASLTYGDAMSKINDPSKTGKIVDKALERIAAKGKRYSLASKEADAEYMKLAEEPEKNAAELNEMVRQAAADAGYRYEGYHGTGTGTFATFKGGLIYHASDRTTASYYSGDVDETIMPTEMNGKHDIDKKSFTEMNKYLRERGGPRFKKLSAIDAKAEAVKRFEFWNKGIFNNPAAATAYGKIIDYLSELNLSDATPEIVRYVDALKASTNTLKAISEGKRATFEDIATVAEVDNARKQAKESLEFGEETYNKYFGYRTGLLEQMNPNSDRFGNGEYIHDVDARSAAGLVKDINDSYAVTKTGMAMSRLDVGDVVDLDTIRKNVKHLKKNDPNITRHGIYHDFLKMNNPLTVDAKGSQWEQIYLEDDFIGTHKAGRYSTDEIAKWSKEHGHDGVIIKNVFDYKLSDYRTTTDYVVFDSSQVKSAEPITFDENWDIIPLSERFNAKNNDVRYSLAPKEKAPKFYSQLERVIESKMPNKMAADQVEKFLLGKGVKAEEIKWSGIKPALEYRKSITKAELLEIARSNSINVKSTTLTLGEIPYTKEQTAEIKQYEDERDAVVDSLKETWTNYFGETFPIRNYGPGLESATANELVEKNSELKNNTAEGKRYKALGAELKEYFENGDDFGYDSWKQAWRDAVKDPTDFIASFEVDDNLRELLLKFAKSKAAYKQIEGVPMDVMRKIRDIAEEADRYNRKIQNVKSKHWADNALHQPKWHEYTLRGSDNYRELIFTLPENEHTNDAMYMHWSGTTVGSSGVIAHARIDDMNIDGKRTMFVEEIQSDWNNQGKKEGFREEYSNKDFEVREINGQYMLFVKGEKAGVSMRIRSNEGRPTSDIREELISRFESNIRYDQNRKAPDAPYAGRANSYVPYVLKNLLRAAAEDGSYDALAWTSAQVQSNRWSDEFAEGYRIEYDIEIPKFLRKYGKQWGAEVSKTNLSTGEEVWYMNITDAMKNSVLYEGQPRFSIAPKENTQNTESGEKTDPRSPKFDAQAYMDEMRQREMASNDRDDFKATQSLADLGIKIAGSEVDYDGLGMLKQSVEMGKAAEKFIRKEENRLHPTEGEKAFAKGIASGIYEKGDIPQSMSKKTVIEMAQAYWSTQNTGNKLLNKRKAQIQAKLDGKMAALMSRIDLLDGKVPKARRLNFRTPARSMRELFGDKYGNEVYESIFAPVEQNTAERERFRQKAYNAVEKFACEDGKQRKLTKDEAKVVQLIIENKHADKLVQEMMMSNDWGTKRDGKVIMQLVKGETTQEDLNALYNSDEARERVNKLAQQIKTYYETQQMIKDKELDQTKLDNAVAAYQAQFDKFYSAVNDVLLAHGYATIGFIKGYAPHMQPDAVHTALQKAMAMMGVTESVNYLPTEIAGRTGDFRPNKRWNPHFLERKGDTTDYDLIHAYEQYVDYMSDVIYHIDDIMRIRAFERYFRATFSEDANSEKVDEAKQIIRAPLKDKLNWLKQNKVIDEVTVVGEEAADEMIREYVGKLYDNLGAKTKHGALVTWLANYANKLAAKQLSYDRSVEDFIGRRALNFANKMNQYFALSQVGGKISSVLNQGAQLPQIYAELGNRYFLRAMKDANFGRLRYSSWAEDSDFITGKNGVDSIAPDIADMLLDKLFAPADFMDGFVTTVAVRGAYLKAIDNGMSHKEAMKAADKFGSEIMGSRMRGVKPLAFESKHPIIRMATIFQIEALNSWDHIISDLPRDFREIESTKGRQAAAGALAGVIIRALLAAFALNRLDDELYGGTPAPFDILGLTANFVASGQGLRTNDLMAMLIDDCWKAATGEELFGLDDSKLNDGKFNWKLAATDTAENITNEVPLLTNIAALLGFGDKSLPFAGSGLNSVFDKIKGDSYTKWPDVIRKAILDFVPAGSQINRTYEGLRAFSQGGNYSSGGNLNYAVNNDLSTWEGRLTAVRMAMFGKYALPEGQRYYADLDYTGDTTHSLTGNKGTAYSIATSAGYPNKDAEAAVRQVWEDTKALNEDGKLTPQNAKTVLDKTDIPKDVKAILWQCMNKGWKGSENPYSTQIGTKIWNYLHNESDDLGIGQLQLPRID